MGSVCCTLCSACSGLPSGRAMLWSGASFPLARWLCCAPGTTSMFHCRAMVEGPDGLFYPSSRVWEERASLLVPVRCQLMNEAVPGSGGEPLAGHLPIYKLLTLRSRLLGAK